ncbi:Methyltransferase domain protein [Actinomadura rubteroloni]|uniref:Methyltransferase domain protein n=1 Tax=Actinomadura rubteroloni TaxID=1926885 RepID=A0A2P4UQ31_9ACTN|nr:class I SAM-dependent methyltransferase [Actinomadura rubteroloni]POM27139.1 Methyltransferase domain protein [Actinomadura rubteroloni]
MTELRSDSDGDLFSERARQYAAERPLARLHILEAGCGWGAGLGLDGRADGTEHQVTGIDLDTPATRAHLRTRADLTAWHLGDLRTVPLPPRAFDIVHAPYLIERVPHAELVLDRFVAALKPGGLLLLRLRDRDSALGFLDRRLLGLAARLPGRPGTAPPPAGAYERVASRQGVQWYCVMRGLMIAEERTSRDALTSLGAATAPLAALCRTVAACSRGRLTAAHTDVSLVIRKPENRYARLL